jgi:hypothetical protein
MYNFGIVAEGVTDQAVIENIIYGFLDENEPESVNWLQPLRDATDSKLGFGNWLNVIEYCKSERLKADFENNDFIIIQIDTDVSEETHFEVSKFDENNQERMSEQLIDAVVEKLNELIIKANQQDFFDFYQSKIIFAIAVHSIECWLLPLHTNTNRNMEVTKNCESRLVRGLRRSIRKEVRIYDDLSRNFIKIREINRVRQHNISLNIFIENLERQVQL